MDNDNGPKVESKRFFISRFSHILTCQMNAPLAAALCKTIQSMDDVDIALYALSEKISNELFRMGKLNLLKKETEHDTGGTHETDSGSGITE